MGSNKEAPFRHLWHNSPDGFVLRAECFLVQGVAFVFSHRVCALKRGRIMPLTTSLHHMITRSELVSVDEQSAT